MTSLLAEAAKFAVKGVFNSLMGSDTSNNSDKNSGGSYNVTGHINHAPVDLQFDNVSHIPSSSRQSNRVNSANVEGVSQISRRYKGNSLEKVQHVSGFSRSVSCDNCNSSNRKKQQFSKKQNSSDNGQFCKVIVPKEGNFIINIQKFESNSAQSNTSFSKSAPKQGPSNITKQQQQQNSNHNQKGNQNQQNLNNKQCNDYQKKQNGKQQQSGNHQQNGNLQQSGNQQLNGTQKQQNRQPKPQNENQNKLKGFQGKEVRPQNNGQLKGKNNSEIQNKGGNRTAHVKNPDVRQNSKKLNGQSQVRGGNSTWMYLGRLSIGTSRFSIQNYLNEKFPGLDFTVEDLPLYKDGKLPCFKVKVDNRILDEFLKLDNWPHGVTITYYIENFKS